MKDTQSLAERSLGAVIEAIASDDVAPGAGSAAAVGLALAAACAGKAVAITLKHRHDAVLTRAQKELSSIAHRALHGADEDAARFRDFIHEKDTPAAQDLLESGTRLQQLGVELLGVLERLADRVDSVVANDIIAARALCTAFGEIQSENLAETREAAERLDGAG
jgi:formiminotetrahydrofolate cyclodeaminase